MDSKALKLEFEKTNQNIQDVMEFLRDYTPTKKEMQEGFAQITIRLDFMQKEIADIKNRLDSLAQRTKEDADAQGKEILSLRKRVEYLEQQIKLLQT